MKAGLFGVRPFFMFTFIALVIAVVALIVAQRAKNRVEQLELELHRRAAAPEPTPAPPPPPPPVQVPHAVRDDIPRYVPPPAAAARAWSIDWENLVGIKLFSWIAGIALVLSAVFLFKYSVEHGWLRPPIRAGIGLLSGIALLVACELRVARNYKFTANAMDGAGIAILYATLFAMHATWQLVPAAVSFLGMLLVTAAAVFLSTRRDSIFIALLGLVGGFATPALLSSGENRPIALFSYLLLLNGGISWIAFRKRWPMLTALSIALTVFYQWAWVREYLTTGQLPLAAGIFVLFAVVGASALFQRDAQPVFRRIAAVAAVVPLIFAFFTAIVPEYGANAHLLFLFLLLMVGGLAAIALLRGPEWLHTVGAIATLVTWFIWLTASYTHASWPWSLVWLAVFVALYLAVGLRLRNATVNTAGLLFFAFIGIALRERSEQLVITGAMLALLTIVMVFSLSGVVRASGGLAGGAHAGGVHHTSVAVIAIALSSIAAMVMDAGLRVELLTQLVLLAALMVIARLFERHLLVVIAVLFYALALPSAEIPTGDAMLLFAGALYALFILYTLLVGKGPLAAALASLVFFFAGYNALNDLNLSEWHGVLAVMQGLVMLLLFSRLRTALLAGAALAFFTAAIPLTFENEWITVALALEAAALAWLFSRIPHRGLLVWSGGLAAAVLIRLAFNPAVFEYHPKSPTPLFNWYLYTYVVCAAAMFLATYFAPRDQSLLRRLFASAGAIELFFLLNIEIADYYSVGDTLTFNFISSSLAQDLTYTIGWALFALTMLVTGIAFGSRGARVAALGLLLITILKCFLHDLARLGGLYRVASLFGLAVSLVAVGLMLQKFVMMKREQTTT